ncbi:MAG: type I restriction endonuclease subunit R [Symploca sp. SIO1B1]|nr:type I restriction endonuclease subunit R [Symploca sp. SIO1B1]
MPQVIGVTKAITSLNKAHQTFKLQPTTNPNFFSEWLGPFPELSLREIEVCDRLRTRYRYYQAEGAITESTVNLIIIAPILELLGLYDPPYLIKGEKYIKIEIEDKDQTLDGLIDILVMQGRLWLILLETKRYGFSVMQALPQTLAYMMSNSATGNPAYGLITTGEDYLFVKLDPQQREYDLSDKFTLSTRRDNQLHIVVQILKQFI